MQYTEYIYIYSSAGCLLCSFLKNGEESTYCKKTDCGMCENVCPQHLPIRDYLEKVAATFER